MGKVTGESGVNEQPCAWLPPRSAVIMAPPHSRQSSGLEVRTLELTQCTDGRAEIKTGIPYSLATRYLTSRDL